MFPEGRVGHLVVEDGVDPRLPLNTHGSGAPPTDWPTGQSNMAADTAGWPGQGSGLVFMLNYGDNSYTMQQFMDRADPPQQFLRRWLTGSSAWSAWRQIG